MDERMNKGIDGTFGLEFGLEYEVDFCLEPNYDRSVRNFFPIQGRPLSYET